MNTPTLTKQEFKTFFKEAKYYGECAPHGPDAVCGRYAMPFSGFKGMHAHDIDQLRDKYAAALRKAGR